MSMKNIIFKSFNFLIAVSLLSGCGLYKKYERPEVDTKGLVRDTVSVLVCKNNLPYAFRNNFFTQSGDYWINTPSARGCDSARTLLKLQVVEGQKTTVTLPMCADQPSVSWSEPSWAVPA